MVMNVDWVFASIGFVRGKKMNVYTDGWRVIGD